MSMYISSVMDRPHPESLGSIGERLELLRLALGYELKQDFARAIGVSPQSLNHYLHGTAMIPPKVVIRLAQICGSEVSGYIYHGSLRGLAHSLAMDIERLRDSPRERHWRQ